MYKIFYFFLKLCILVAYIWKANLSLAQLRTGTVQVGQENRGDQRGTPKGQQARGTSHFLRR